MIWGATIKRDSTTYRSLQMGGHVVTEIHGVVFRLVNGDYVSDELLPDAISLLSDHRDVRVSVQGVRSHV